MILNAVNAVVAGLLLLSPPGTSTGGGGGESFKEGRTVGVRLENSRIVITGNGIGGRSDGYRIKRPCWYEPAHSAADMLKSQQASRDWWFRYTPGATEKKYQRFLKQFSDKVGKEGRWWAPAYNGADPDGMSCWNGLEPFVWVPPGTTPPSGITAEELAQIARAALTVPEPRIRLSPDATSYVNLPTWVWLDRAGAVTRSVTATIPGFMSATVTATLGNLRIDPGTASARAEVRQRCGAGGRPYTRGTGEGAFTCGVRYLRASADQPRDAYRLTVTSVWNVAVRGAVTAVYDPIEVSATRDVPVGEVQSTVRGGR
ncbi:hypothetical protein GCM10017673_40730 [Streptosporangium violaceochromogenes]|nr:hypothetical protein GCM10017673_40730 [Streptosporangium violaceochromogenes]